MSVLIPAYRPGAALPALVSGLRAARPGLPVIVVDDGSGPAYGEVFASARAAGAELVSFPDNRGKGAALRSGFAYLELHHPDEAVVCADADGQHLVPDILGVLDEAERTGQATVGVRAFDGRVPLRSRFGNGVTRLLFAAATRRWLTDTQTGLRAYPATALHWLQQVEGDRYEYELRLLLRATREQLPFRTIPIQTVYLDDNSSSRFRPLADSVRIYLPLLGFALSSLAAFLIDTAVLLVMHAVTGALLPAVVAARITSASVNFTVNRRLLSPERDRRTAADAAWRYLALAIAVLIANYLLMAALTGVGIGLLTAKVATELTLFGASYALQRRVVFRRGAAGENRTATAQQERSDLPVRPGTVDIAHTR